MAKAETLKNQEELHDVAVFLQNFRPRMVAIDCPSDTCDVECVIETVAEIDEVISFMEMQPDSHVMIDTIKPINEYTGERV